MSVCRPRIYPRLELTKYTSFGTSVFCNGIQNQQIAVLVFVVYKRQNILPDLCTAAERQESSLELGIWAMTSCKTMAETRLGTKSITRISSIHANEYALGWMPNPFVKYSPCLILYTVTTPVHMELFLHVYVSSQRSAVWLWPLS